MQRIMRYMGTAGLCLFASAAFAESAANWQYDGEFQTTNTAGTARNRPMFLDINHFGELIYGHLGSGNPSTNNEAYVVGDIFAPADPESRVVPVNQVKLDHTLFSDNGTLRGISGVACQPGTGDVYLTSDAGAVRREIQVLTRTGNLTFTAGTTMSLSNQLRVMGAAFSPVNPNILVSGELDVSGPSTAFNVYDVSAGTTFTLLGRVDVPMLTTGRYIRDLTVDMSETVWLNVNGTITRMPGAGLNSIANVATYTSATATHIHFPGADNDINPMGISWSNVTDEPIVIANGGTNAHPSTNPRSHRVWNAETGEPILQYTDGGTSNALRATESPNGDFLQSCDSKAVLGPDNIPYLFISELSQGRIIRFKAVPPPTTAREWNQYE